MGIKEDFEKMDNINGKMYISLEIREIVEVKTGKSRGYVLHYNFVHLKQV